MSLLPQRRRACGMPRAPGIAQAPPPAAACRACRCRAVPEGQLGVLAVLREGQPQPLHLLHEARKAKGRVQAAVATWR